MTTSEYEEQAVSDAEREDLAPQTPVDAVTSSGGDAAGGTRSETSDEAEVLGDGAVEEVAEQGGLAAERQPAEEDPRTREQLLAELDEAEARRDEYLDDVRRTRAEFENYRKRIMREGASQREAGRAEAVSALLEVLDDLDRTLVAAEGSPDDSLARGVQLVASKLVEALRGLGLERIDEVGVAFDPSLHEAVQHRQAEAARASGQPAADAAQQTDEAAEATPDGPVVVEVLRPGYRVDERVLRPAMVAVED